MKKLLQLLSLFLLFAGTAEAQWFGQKITAIGETPVTTLTDGYYVMRNVGRNNWASMEHFLQSGFYPFTATTPTTANATGREALLSDEVLTNAGSQCKNAFVFYVTYNSETQKATIKSWADLYVDPGYYIAQKTILVGNPKKKELDVRTDNNGHFYFSDTDGVDDNAGYAYMAPYGKVGDSIVATGTGNQSWELYAVTLSDLTALTSSPETGKKYVLAPQEWASRGIWAANSADLTYAWSSNKLGLILNVENPYLQFAFVEKDGQKYLYNVGAKKFVTQPAGGTSANYLLLTDAPYDVITTRASAGDFVAGGTKSAPFVLRLQGRETGDICLSTGYTQGVCTSWNNTQDGGNCINMYEVGDFDPTEALAAFDAALPTADGSKAYVIRNMRSRKYATYAGESTAMSQEQAVSNSAKWMFYPASGGSDGVVAAKIYNPTNKKYLNGPSSFADSEAEATTWYIQRNTNGQYYGLCISSNATISNNAALNDYQQTSITTWYGNDSEWGSVFQLEELTRIYPVEIGDDLGQYSSNSSTLSGDELQNIVNSGWGSAEEMTYVNTLSLNLPAAGTFFRVKTAPARATTTFSGVQPYLISENSTEKTTRAAFSQNAGADASSVFYYTGKYVIALKTGYPWIQSNEGYGHLAIGTGEQYMNTNATTITFSAAANGELGAYNVCFAGDRYLFTNANYYTDAGNGASDAGYNFSLEKVEELPVTISNIIKYATFCAPVAVSIPEGVTAFKAEVDVDILKLTSIDDGVIPANFPVILKAKDITEATTFNFPITTTNVTYEGNKLEGTTAAIAAPEGIYTLQKGSNGIGFYKKASGTTFKGFSAYLPGTVAGSVRSFSFDEVTGIANALNEQTAAGTAYDLQGRRVSNLSQGLYIVNGKKVFIK